MMRFIVEIGNKPEYVEDYPDEIIVRVKLEDGTILYRDGGQINNPNLMEGIWLKMIREYRASLSGVPMQHCRIMSEADIDEEIA